MELTDQTKILILVAMIGVVVFFFFTNRSEDVAQNSGSLKQNVQNNVSEAEAVMEVEAEGESEMEQASQEQVLDESPELNEQVLAESPELNANTLRKLRTRNSSRDGSFVNSSYADGRRGGSADIDKFFEGGFPFDEKVGFQQDSTGNLYSNVPSGAGAASGANYIPGKPRKQRTVDKFNAEALLPKEKHKDWMDDPYASTSVKNTHLINIYRPIGVNTIQTTLKNASWDLRGASPNPKYAVSPWQNSSYEPDTNLRNQSLCY